LKHERDALLTWSEERLLGWE